jgi:arsenate reductase
MLNDAGVTYTVRRYLDDPPSAEELRGVLDRLGLEPWDITRTGEPEAKSLGITGWAKDAGSREEWIAALASHPKLIQRPIITADDGTTVVGRTEEAVRSVLP